MCRSVKIWDYQNKTCVQTLTGHTHNVSVACFHPELPIIITGSEDGMFCSCVLLMFAVCEPYSRILQCSHARG